MKLRVVFAVHICIFIYSCIIYVFESLGKEYFKYIYLISSLKIAGDRFDIVWILTLLSVVLFFVDMVLLIESTYKLIERKNSEDKTAEATKTCLFWIFIAIINCLTIYMFFMKYIVFIT